MEIGNKLKKLRKEKNLTQNQLAKMLNVSSSTIQSYELNRRKPPIDILAKIGLLFSVDINTIISKTDSSQVTVTDAQLLKFTELINEILQENNKFKTESIYHILDILIKCIKTANEIDDFNEVFMDFLELYARLDSPKK